MTLSRNISTYENKLFEDLASFFVAKLFKVLVVLAGKPKTEVLFGVLFFQEFSECRKSCFVRDGVSESETNRDEVAFDESVERGSSVLLQVGF